MNRTRSPFFALFPAWSLPLPWLLLSMACISYSGTPEPGRLRQGISFDGNKQDIRLSFIAWGDQGRYTEPIRERFKKSGWTMRPDAPVLLEVILEERRSTNGLLKLLNFIATAASGTAIPFYNQVNYSLRFRRFSRGRLLDSCAYELRNNEFLSLFLLPAAPFIWSTSVLRARLEKTTDAYIASCAKSNG